MWSFEIVPSLSNLVFVGEGFLLWMLFGLFYLFMTPSQLSKFCKVWSSMESYFAGSIFYFSERFFLKQTFSYFSLLICFCWMINEDSFNIILSYTLFSSTFRDWFANLNVESVCVKLISAGLIVQIKIVWLLVVRDEDSTRVSLESLKGTWPLNINN